MSLDEFLASPLAELIALVTGALVLAGVALLTLRWIVTVLVARERRQTLARRMGTPGGRRYSGRVGGAALHNAKIGQARGG